MRILNLLLLLCIGLQIYATDDNKDSTPRSTRKFLDPSPRPTKKPSWHPIDLSSDKPTSST